MTHITRRQALVGAAAAPVALASAPTASAASAVQDSRQFFTPSAPLARGTVFTRSVSAMPVASNSARLASAMASLPSKYAGANGFGWLRSSLNTVAYNIPIYVVDSRVPGCPTRAFSVDHYECAGDPVVDGPRIPCPRHAQPAWGSDGALAIYDRGTGILREYFHVDTSGSTWGAATAGYTVIGPDFAGLARKDPAMQVWKGSSAVVKMHNPLSQIGLRELEAGVINHAVSVTFAEAAQGSSWPAKQGDGHLTPGSAPVEGQWFRLPPTLDIDALNLRPVTRLIAKAVQRFGGYGADRNGWCHAFNMESPFTVPGGTEDKLIKPLVAAYGVGIDGQIVNDFPWHLTQWAPIGWNSIAQASGLGTPWRYSQGDWSASFSGSWAARPNTRLLPHEMRFDGAAAYGKSATMVWKRRRAVVGSPVNMVIAPRATRRDGALTISVINNGKTVAKTSSRSLHSLRFTLGKGNNDVQIRVDAASPSGRGRYNDVVSLSAFSPR